MLAEAQQGLKELRGKYEALLLYATRPSGASLSKRAVYAAARQGGVIRPLVPTRKPAEVEHVSSPVDSREGSPTPAVGSTHRPQRAVKRNATMVAETEKKNIERMELRGKKSRSANNKQKRV